MTPKISAGLVIIQDNKILLVHPRNASWWHSYSIPKGLVEKNEELLNAAIRETKEEIGLEFGLSQCYAAQEFHFLNKIVHTFIVKTIQPISLVNFIPNNEVDWAGFLSKEEARRRIQSGFEPLLQYLK